MVIAGMATVRWRQKEMLQAVASLYDQVDELHIYLNNYPVVPSQLKKPKIKVYPSTKFGLKGAEAKFFKVSKGYYFSVDDDIIYPKDYVKKSVDTIEKYDRKYVVSYHGSIIRPTLESYLKGRRTVYFGNKKDHDTFIHVPGTGVTAFHTDTLKLKIEDFPMPNMVDIYFGIKCQEQEVGIICPAKNRAWIQRSPISDSNRSIYASVMNNDSMHTKLVRSIKWRLFANVCSRCFRFL